MRLGILGGTFNPPHLGHLICAQEAQLELSLERVLLMPTRIPPHKSVVQEPGPEHRLALCRAAVERDGRLEVSDLEIVRDGPSYTVDTLEELKRQDPDTEFFFIVGGDIAAGLPDWHRSERVLELSTLAVAGRRGTSRAAVQEALARLPGAERSRFFKMPSIAISSTLIRERVRAGAPIRYMVPPAVSAYIDEHGLYGGPAST